MKRATILLTWCWLLAFGCQQPLPDRSNEGGLEVSLQDLFERKVDRVPLISAHRGGPYPGYPENCIETFEYVISQVPVLIECDVARAGDGTLVLMHDETLDRTTTGSGKVSGYTRDQLKELQLVDNQGRKTSYKIPTLRETLKWSKDKAILTVDIKRSVPFEEVVNMIEEEGAQGHVVLITYTIGAAIKLHRLNPELLLSVTIRNSEEFDRLKQSGISLNKVIAFAGTSEPLISHYDELHEAAIFCILGTLGNLDRRAQARGDHIYQDFVNRGADIIATDRPLEVGAELAKVYDLTTPYKKELVSSH